MFDLLRDPLWQFIGAFFALLTVAVTVLIYVLQRRKKRLSYEILSNSTLMTMREELEGRLEIRFDGEQVSNLHILEFKLFNSGNVPIASTDYERKLEFDCGDEANVLSAEVTETVPADLNATIALVDNKIVCEPLLLNSKDSVSIKALISDYDGGLTSRARIIGVKTIKRGSPGQAASLGLMFDGALLSVGSLIVVSFTLPEFQAASDTAPDVRFIIGLAVAFVGYALAGFGMLRTPRYRNLLVSLGRGFLQRVR